MVPMRLINNPAATTQTTRGRALSPCQKLSASGGGTPKSGTGAAGTSTMTPSANGTRSSGGGSGEMGGGGFIRNKERRRSIKSWKTKKPCARRAAGLVKNGRRCGDSILSQISPAWCGGARWLGAFGNTPWPRRKPPTPETQSQERCPLGTGSLRWRSWIG